MISLLVQHRDPGLSCVTSVVVSTEQQVLKSTSKLAKRSGISNKRKNLQTNADPVRNLPKTLTNC